MGNFLIENDEVLENTSQTEIKTLISYDSSSGNIGIPHSEKLRIKEELVKEILNLNLKKEPFYKVSEEPRFGKEVIEPYTDKVIIPSWKNVENISARLINHYDETVVLECLIDKENNVYEEREFRASLFEDYNIKQGNLFFLRVFERKNEVRLEIHDDPGLTRIEDFPKMDFLVRYYKSRLFKDNK
jgi:hypothetical protein